MGAPATVESRTSCPACGGQVHPIAGRCKHCKADLARMRAGAPPAQHAPPRITTLADLRPALPLPLGSGPVGGGAVGPVAEAPPEGARAGRWSTLWPLIVAAIAICAIIASVAMLVFGGNKDEKKSTKARRFEGPAPDLMQTDPGARQVAPGVPQGGGGPTPSMPDPDVAPAPPSLPRAPIVPSPPSGFGPASFKDFVTEAVEVGCRRLKSCPDTSELTQFCSLPPDMLTGMGESMGVECNDFDSGAGRACIDSIGRLPCPAAGADPMAVATTLMGLSDCRKVCPTVFGALDDPDTF